MLKDGKLINPELRIETTSFCNARCVTCPREKLTRRQMTMCYGEFCSLVDQGVELGAKMVSLFGFGEPLMDTELEEKVGYCSDNRLSTFITSNGSLLGNERANGLLDAGLKNIRFSLHAIAPLNHERVHRRLKWHEVYRNVLNFIYTNQKRNSPCTVHITCIPLHGESVDDIVATWGGLADYLEVWKPHNWCGGREFRKIDAKRKKTCGRPFSGPVQVQADGTIIPCCFITNSELVMGDTHDNTIKEILLNDQYNSLRQRHTVGIHLPPCNTCDQLNDTEESPLLYSSRDETREVGTTSTCKISVQQ